MQGQLQYAMRSVVTDLAVWLRCVEYVEACAACTNNKLPNTKPWIRDPGWILQCKALVGMIVTI